MTHLEIITPIFLMSFFIILHFIFYGRKNAKNNNKIKELNPIYLFENYEIIEISKSNFIAKYKPLNYFIYITPTNKKSVLVPNPICREIMKTKKDAFLRLQTFILNLEK